MLEFFLFLFGASLGSFINVISLRYNPDKSLWSIVHSSLSPNRSHCPNCQKTLEWYELIPIVSFIIQLGRCRSCKKKLSWQYPIVEVLMGGLAIGLWQFISPIGPIGLMNLIFSLFLLSTLVTIALIDLRTTIIPDELIIVSLILITPLTLLSPLKPLPLFYGALLGGGFFSALWLAGQGRWMGLGDGKLGAILGLWLGFPNILLALGFAFVSGSMIAIILMALKLKTMKDAIPFGPFLVLGGIVAFFLRQWLEGWWKAFL